MKSDPLQGILFDSPKPLRLKKRAAERAKITLVDDVKPSGFFHKLHLSKPDIQRLSRRSKTPLNRDGMKYELYAPRAIRVKFKKS